MYIGCILGVLRVYSGCTYWCIAGVYCACKGVINGCTVGVCWVYNLGLLRVYAGCIIGMFLTYSGRIVNVFKVYSGCILGEFGVHSL